MLEPGWRWSTHVKPVAGTELCEYHHIGYVMSGRLHLLTAGGVQLEVGPGDVFDIPSGHDAWVVGDEPWVGLQWAGIRTWGAALLASGERVLTTLLFTDIVDSTAMLERMGDVRWRELMASYREASASALKRSGAGRSHRPAMGSSRPSTGRHAPPDARLRFARRPSRSACERARASTPVR
ncbi:MAG: hypothetical protein ABJB65_06700 [Chloroflexota bacterium]